MANMNDVAKLAKVSRGTVSNYINGVKIKNELAERVAAAIHELDYVPNQAARALKKNSSDTVVLILPTIWTPFFAELTFYIQTGLQERGIKMLLGNSQNDYNLELDYLKMAQEEKVRGIITITYSEIRPFVNSKLPIVTIERYLSNDFPFISSDNFKGAQLAVKEMANRGSRKMLMILRKLESNLGMSERVNGFIDYCRHHKLPYEVYLDEEDSEGFSRRLESFLVQKYQDDCPYDGIFAATDRYAEYVLHAFRKLPWRIPDDVQLVGFDGSRSYPSQPLTISTIQQDIKQIANLSIEEVLSFNPEKKEQNKHILPVTFQSLATTRTL